MMGPSTSFPIRTMGTVKNTAPAFCRECNAPIANDAFLCDDCLIVQHALTAFWAVVAAAHPQIASGDGDYSEFERVCRQEIATWVSNNSITCDNCGRNCTIDRVATERLEHYGDPRMICEDCLLP